MNDLPGRDDPGSNFNRWEVWEAYKRGVLKSRDEMDMKALAKITGLDGFAGLAEAWLDAAWGEVADE